LLRAFAEAEERHRAAPGPARGAASLRATVAALVRARAERPEPLTDVEVAQLCLALTDVDARDACLRWLSGPLADAAEGLWLELVRRAVPPYRAAPATLLAFQAYARGDGTFARICAERALAEDPGCSMAGLVCEALDRGIQPKAIRRLVRGKALR
jgi:hypothetical protein